MLDKTKEVLLLISNDPLFKENDIRFVGGTALSYHIQHRLSEDLDFATLKLDPVLIYNTMIKYGANKIELNDSIKDSALNEGEDINYSYLKYMLDGVKIEFFEPPFNTMEVEIWTHDPYTQYENTNVKLMSLQGISYMKTMAFWNRKKYRDVFDIYYLLENNIYTVKEFLENYIKYNILYTKEQLLTKIEDKHLFSEKADDEGINTLVEDSKPYEWYRNKIEKLVREHNLELLF